MKWLKYPTSTYSVQLIVAMTLLNEIPETYYTNLDVLVYCIHDLFNI